MDVAFCKFHNFKWSVFVLAILPTFQKNIRNRNVVFESGSKARCSRNIRFLFEMLLLETEISKLTKIMLLLHDAPGHFSKVIKSMLRLASWTKKKDKQKQKKKTELC